MAKQKRPTISYCKDGTIIIKGVHPSDFRSILTAASLHQYAEEDKHGKFGREPEFDAIDERLGLKEVKLRNWAWDYAWRQKIRWIIACLDGEETKMRSNRLLRTLQLRDFFERFRALAKQAGVAIRPEDL